MERVYNFSAGPSMLPEAALKKAQKEMLVYNNSGMSVMEMSHRSADYKEIIDSTEQLIRELMQIPNNYKVLFLQGGASSQFAMVPLNLFKNSKKADYMITGVWAKKAFKEASKFGKVNAIASSEDKTFNYIPEFNKEDLDKEADYLHITTNNTIYGTRFTELPDTGNVPLVADMSSNILSQTYDVSKFGLIYAGAQKNMGPAGVTLVIIREDLIGNAAETIPTMLNYKTHSDTNSMFNTPPTYNIYICNLVFEWLKEIGGISAMERINIEKSKMLYDLLDESKVFKGTANIKDRSLMNIPFVCSNEQLNTDFIKQSTDKGFVNLKGHRSVGGMRASIYNAMPVEGVRKLVEFMKEFEMKNK